MKKKSIIVLGAGLVGGPMAIDLAKDQNLEVTVVDANPEAVEKLSREAGLTTVLANLADQQRLAELVKPFDMVLDALPGFMGYQAVKTCIEAGKNVVDIAFFPEDPFTLNELALEKGVTVIVDMGVAPGMSHLLTGYAASLLDQTERVQIYVGGLPLVRKKPFEYKAVFSPIDVIEEYTRPARFIRNGQQLTMPALSEPELMDFDGVGTLEAFNSDGLRSLFSTINAPNIIEKTLRYPGHVYLMNVMKELGLFNQEPVLIKGVAVRPIDLTTHLLFPFWKLQEGEEDLTVMRIIVEGIKDLNKIRYDFDLLDRYDTASQTHSMARTTGYTATAAVRMCLNGLCTRTGVLVPEMLGENHDCVAFLLEQLRDRGVIYKMNQSRI